MLPIDAKQIPALFQKARGLQAQGALEQAQKIYHSILSVKPDLAEVHFNLAQIEGQRRNWPAAFDAIRRAQASKPNEPAIWSVWADLVGAAQNTPQKIIFRDAVEKSKLPGAAKTQLMQKAGLSGSSEATFKAQIKADKKSPKPLIEYGDFLLKEGRVPAALKQFELAAKRAPNTAFVHYKLATALRTARRDQAALKAYDRALKLDPQAAALLAEKAMLLQNLGALDEARHLFARAVEIEPENGSLYLLYLSAGKISADDRVVKKTKDRYEAETNDRHLAFARAKIAETEGENPFPYLKRGNSLSRKAFPYDFEKDAQAAAQVRKLFLDHDRAAWARVASDVPKPIFVTGMPRSGTTLVEQIIAAHSKVAGAGEVGVLGRLLGDVHQPPKTKVLLEKYWNMLQDRYPAARHITDKSIGTYVHIGFIKTLFPQAKIVVVSRDPRDNALSIYKNMFADGLHRYSNDLGDIARFMRMFEAQVAFWQEHTPDAFTTISYEALIAEPEAQSRRLIQDVGLEWEDACLSFYQNKARVDTLSNAQVRQPIYASSVGAWRTFEDELAPFFNVYGPIQSL